MFRKIRFVLVKSAHSKEGLDEKNPDQPKPEKPKSKNKFLGLFHSSSDPDLNPKQKTRKSFLRRKKNNEKETKDSQDEAASEILTNHTERLPDNLLPDGPLPDEPFPDGQFPDEQLPDKSFPDNLVQDNVVQHNLVQDNVVPDNLVQDNVVVENNIVDNFENASQKHSLLGETLPLDPLKSMSVSTLGSMHRVNRIDIDPFPPDGEAWKRAKDVWEKNEIEETKEKEKRKTKGRKEHHDKKREGKEERDGKSRQRSKSREKDKDHAEKERSDSKNRSKVKKRHEKLEPDEGKYEEKRSKEDKHKKHKSRTEKHGSGHKRDSDSELDNKHERKTDRIHKHKSRTEEHGGGHKRDMSRDYDSDSELDNKKHERKTDRRHKHKSRTEEHGGGHKRDMSRDYDSNSELDNKHVRIADRRHKHEHRHKDSDHDRTHDDAHEHVRTLDRVHAKEHKHQPTHKDDKHTKNNEELHKHSKHKEPKTEHKHTKNLNPYAEDKRKIELDKVWREYESGKRYHSQEKDMKKIIDRLDGVERFRREERNRMSDRSHDRSSDTSHEAAHRSRSRERRRRSRSREKHRHESDQDSNHSSTWQYSLSRIEARQEQCKAEIDTARRSIEHRIKQLETRFEKHYSSSERLPDQPREKSSAEEPPTYKKIIDQVADECREVTRTLEVRTEEMKSEIASVVREELTHLDESLHSPNTTSSSPGPFFGVRVVGNFRCEETTTVNPGKVIRDDDDDKSKLTCVTSVEPLSSADESMITVIEENSRITRTTPKDCADAESHSTPSSRDFQVRVSQSGALDTQNEPPGQKHSVSSTCDSGISADHPTSPIHLRSPGIENLHELSLENFEDEAHCDETHQEAEGHDCNGTPESLQEVYRRKIKETEARCQERALEEKEILYRRINELESMLLASREGKGQYV